MRGARGEVVVAAVVLDKSAVRTELIGLVGAKAVVVEIPAPMASATVGKLNLTMVFAIFKEGLK